MWSRHLRLCCYLWRFRQTQSCCEDAGLWTCAERLTADIRMPVASCVSLFFYSVGGGASSEARRAGQSSSRRGPKSHFPHGFPWHRFQARWNISIPIAHSPRVSRKYHNIVFGFPAYLVRFVRFRAYWFLAGWGAGDSKGGMKGRRRQICFDSAQGFLFAVYAAEFRKRHIKW